MSQKTNTPISLQSGEEVIITIRRHWIVLAYSFLFLLILIVTSAVAIIISQEIIKIIGSALFWWGISLYWLIFLTFIFVSWIYDELDIFIVTNKRIISIDRLWLFIHRTQECALDKVEEIDTQIAGIFQHIFYYWHIDIRTASGQSNMRVRYAPKPKEITTTLNAIIQENTLVKK